MRAAAAEDVRRRRHHAGPAQANQADAVITVPVHDSNATNNAPDGATHSFPAPRRARHTRTASWGHADCPFGSLRADRVRSSPRCRAQTGPGWTADIPW